MNDRHDIKAGQPWFGWFEMGNISNQPKLLFTGIEIPEKCKNSVKPKTRTISRPLRKVRIWPPGRVLVMLRYRISIPILKSEVCEATLRESGFFVGPKVAELAGHTVEVCGLQWRIDGAMLASGGNDNLVHIWDARSSIPRLTKTNHTAAVKVFQTDIFYHQGNRSVPMANESISDRR